MEDLYTRDYYLWTKEQSSALKAKHFVRLDFDNLIEEIEQMGRSEKNALRSYVLRLLEHLLKYIYWTEERERCKNGWINEIDNFRDRIEGLLTDSPSLKNYLAEIYSERLSKAKRNMSRFFDIPERANISFENALDQNWFGEDC